MPSVVAARARTALSSFIAACVVGGSPAAAGADAASPAGGAAASGAEWPERLGPSASFSLGAGYSFFESENGGISVVGLADLGWFVTDRLAVLAGATLLVRPGDEDLRHTLWRLGVEWRVDRRHYLRVSLGRSVVRRQRDELDEREGLETLGEGEAAQVVAGVPASAWGWGEVSFQFVAGAAHHHGDDTRSSYAGFFTTCLEFAVR